MGAIGDLCNSISSLAVVQEDLGILPNADKVITGWCVLQVLHEFRVRFDRLETTLSPAAVTYGKLC